MLRSKQEIAMRSMRLAPMVLLIGLAAACGGNDTGSGDGEVTGITVEELPAAYAETLCDVLTSCVGDLWTFFRPGEDCVKGFTVTAEEELSTLPTAIGTGRVKYHGDKVQKCLDDVAARGCSGLGQREPESCRAAIEGTVAAGGDCELDSECSGEQYCKVGGACPGTCSAYEQAGGKCTSNDHCASGLKCSTAGFCVAPAQQDEACNQGEPDCADGLICLGEDAAQKTPGTCRLIEDTLSGQAGDACSLAGPLCAGGLACEIKTVSPLAGECIPRVAAGAACHAAFPDECPDDQYCLLPANPLDAGTCTDKPKAGEPCAKGVGADANICAPYARCDAGVCRELAHAGESCSTNATCYSDHCDGACVTANACQ